MRCVGVRVCVQTLVDIAPRCATKAGSPLPSTEKRSGASSALVESQRLLCCDLKCWQLSAPMTGCGIQFRKLPCVHNIRHALAMSWSLHQLVQKPHSLSTWKLQVQTLGDMPILDRGALVPTPSDDRSIPLSVPLTVKAKGRPKSRARHKSALEKFKRKRGKSPARR